MPGHDQGAGSGDVMNEFSFIEELTSALRARHGAVEGVGDDAALLEVPSGKQLAVTTDTLVEGVHFDAATSPSDLGHKSLAVNLSDLAAMGAEPAWYFLALTLPSMDSPWIREFARGMHALAQRSGIRLAGGDTTRGPLNITITACGLVEAGKALTRSGAKVGDVIMVSGPTGLAACALGDITAGRIPAPACEQSLRRPEPRTELGRALLGLARSCIDVSDGLLADLRHVAAASGVGARLALGSLPVPPELVDLPEEKRWDLQLGGGDDYELCFTAPPERCDEIKEKAAACGLEATAIGEVVAGEGCVCIRPDGGEFRPRRAGYDHGVLT